MGFNGPSNEPAGHPGSRTVFCVKLGRQLPGLDEIPWPGELGRRIYDNVSAAAWKMWEDRMRMILNEYRMLPYQPEAQAFMARLMEEYLFGEDDDAPQEDEPRPTE